jgi:hypothetical protein
MSDFIKQMHEMAQMGGGAVPHATINELLKQYKLID